MSNPSQYAFVFAVALCDNFGMSPLQILAAVAIAIGLPLSAFNWATAFPRRDGKYVSPVPLVGGLLLAVGFLAFEATRRYWWCAVVIDFGTLGFLAALPMIIRETWAHSDRNALHVFDNKTNDRTVKVQLFRNGDCVIDIRFNPPRPHGSEGQRAVSAGFVGKWRSIDQQFVVTGYGGGRTLRIAPGAEGRFTVSEEYPDGQQPSIYGLHGVALDARRLTTDH